MTTFKTVVSSLECRIIDALRLLDSVMEGTSGIYRADPCLRRIGTPGLALRSAIISLRLEIDNTVTVAYAEEDAEQLRHLWRLTVRDTVIPMLTSGIAEIAVKFPSAAERSYAVKLLMRSGDPMSDYEVDALQGNRTLLAEFTTQQLITRLTALPGRLAVSLSAQSQQQVRQIVNTNIDRCLRENLPWINSFAAYRENYPVAVLSESTPTARIVAAGLLYDQKTRTLTLT